VDTSIRSSVGPTIAELTFNFDLMLQAQGKSPATRKDVHDRRPPAD
jgi:hypothetical protein